MEKIIQINTFLALYSSILIGLCSCQQNNDSNGVIINNFTEPIIEYSSDQFSSLVSEYRFVKLETTTEINIGEIVEIVKNNNQFFVKTRSQELFLFDNNGMFVRQIGSRGRGPGEYFIFSCFAVNKSGKLVAIAGNREIRVYDVSTGLFIRKFETGLIPNMAYLTDDTFIVRVAREDYVLALIDVEGELIIKYGDPNTIPSNAYSFPFIRIDNEKTIFQSPGATDYHLFDSKARTFSKGLIIDEKKALESIEMKKEMDATGGQLSEDFLNQSIRINQLKFINKDIFIYHAYQTQGFVSLYNKKKDKLIRCNLTDRGNKAKLDDILFIDSKYFLKSFFCSTDDISIITFIDAFDFLEKFDPDKSAAPNQMENYLRAKELFNSLTIEDNPIIIEFEFKQL